MQTPFGHITYCTNIHAGESWDDHFAAIRANIPIIKKSISPDASFGIGLRLSNQASLQLSEKIELQKFLEWLQQEHCYVFTMNGFPYGGFHHTSVKDQVHAPDWTTRERVDYTLRLFFILAEVLQEGEGGISTSPLSYKPWHVGNYQAIFEAATKNILFIVEQLIDIHAQTGKLLHLDIEPEPDGLLESGPEFISWYEQYLLPLGIDYFKKRRNYSSEESNRVIKNHIRLCYDVCHFAVGYEDHKAMISILKEKEIGIGKIQISAALKTALPGGHSLQHVANAFSPFNESTYLHQVVAMQKNGSLKRYPDLPQALQDIKNANTTQWRAHFHVPVFLEDLGVLKSTQSDIKEVLQLHKLEGVTTHFEVETYTWEVLPEELKQPLSESIIRELQWVTDYLLTSK